MTAKININRRITKAKRKIAELIDKKLDPQRKEREIFLRRYSGLSRKAGSPKEYLGNKFPKLKQRFSLFNEFFTTKGAPLNFKMVNPEYIFTPKEILNRKYGKRRDNYNVFDHELMEIIKNEKNNKSKIQQLKGLKFEINKFEELRQKFVSQLDKESLAITEKIISLEKEYFLVKDKIKFDQKTKLSIDQEINSWKNILANLRAFVREINNNPIDTYYKTIDNNISRLSKS